MLITTFSGLRRGSAMPNQCAFVITTGQRAGRQGSAIINPCRTLWFLETPACREQAQCSSKTLRRIWQPLYRGGVLLTNRGVQGYFRWRPHFRCTCLSILTMVEVTVALDDSSTLARASPSQSPVASNSGPEASAHAPGLQDVRKSVYIYTCHYFCPAGIQQGD